MEISFRIQYIIAFILTVITVLFSFFKLVEDKTTFFSLSTQGRLYFSSIIINMIFLSIVIIYSILYCFWTTITCCWRSKSSSATPFSCWNAFFSLLFMCANGYILYSLYVYPLVLPHVLEYVGNIMLIYIGLIIFEGILFSFIRCCVNNSGNKRKFLPNKETQDFNQIV